MGRPFRRFCFTLAEKLGKSYSEIEQLSSKELSEWMAYFQTQDEKWLTNYYNELDAEKQRADPEYAAMKLKAILGGK